MSKIALPTYPATDDVWKSLKRERRPIIIYGMGNGADKLLWQFEKYGISYADFMASDGFVRGHFFHGIRVKGLREIQSLYPEFVIVLSFASNREEVLSLFSSLDSSFDMYIPDMPVAGNAYFTSEFYNENYAKIALAYEALQDDFSKNLYASILHFKLSGKLRWLLSFCSKKEEIYSILSEKDVRVALDGGAYNGDTAKEFLSEFANISRILAVEPDPKTFRRLCRTASGEFFGAEKIEPINAALGSHEGECIVHASGNRNTSLVGASYEYKEETIPALTIDKICEKTAPDFIKLDIEGEELNALLGAVKTIREYSPALLISLYHRSEDIFSLILYMRESYPNYRLYLRRIACVPAWEIDLLALPT